MFYTNTLPVFKSRALSEKTYEMIACCRAITSENMHKRTISYFFQLEWPQCLKFHYKTTDKSNLSNEQSSHTYANFLNLAINAGKLLIFRHKNRHNANDIICSEKIIPCSSSQCHLIYSGKTVLLVLDLHLVLLKTSFTHTQKIN